MVMRVAETMSVAVIMTVIMPMAGRVVLMMAVTVCRLERVRASNLEYVRNNIARFSIGQFQVWINAAVGWRARGIDGKLQREVSGNSRSPVNLDIDAFMINDTGNRLSGL